jgi:hypothetical protein
MGSETRSVPAMMSSLALLAASLAVFLTYLIPEWRAFFLSDVFMFANGWDEETYLSWQGMNGFKTVPGYFPLHLNLALQEIGLSGAVQNLILDTVLPPATALLVFLTLKLRQVESARAVAYATLICFGSVLFNANNPWIANMLGDTRSNTILIMSGWEVYASILRTPNPEIPFFLIACAVYASARLGRWWILLLPLPLLYYPTAVPYSFLLMLVFSYRQLRSRYSASPATAIFAASAITFVLMGIGLVGLSYLVGLYQPDNTWRNDSYLFSATRRPQLPVGLIALALLFLLGALGRLVRLDRSMMVPIAILAIAALGSVNLHLFTGFMLSQKNYYDYGLSILLAILAAIWIDSFRDRFVKNAALFTALAVIFLFSYRSQAIWFANGIQLSREMSPDIAKVRSDPLRAIFSKIELAAHVPFSTARLLAPVSNLYSSKEYTTQCAGFAKVAENSATFVKQHFAEKNKQLAVFLNSVAVLRSVDQIDKKSKPDASYCRDVDFDNRNFFLAGPELP